MVNVAERTDIEQRKREGKRRSLLACLLDSLAWERASPEAAGIDDIVSLTRGKLAIAILLAWYTWVVYSSTIQKSERGEGENHQGIIIFFCFTPYE